MHHMRHSLLSWAGKETEMLTNFPDNLSEPVSGVSKCFVVDSAKVGDCEKIIKGQMLII